MTGQPTATVVGGGVAGLASAVPLTQAGWRVTVLERAAAFGEVGAGLGQGPDAAGRVLLGRSLVNYPIGLRAGRYSPGIIAFAGG